MLRNPLKSLRALFRREIADTEITEELRFHFDKQVEKLVQSGLPVAEARRQARLVVGGFDLIEEQCRDVRCLHWLDLLFGDIRYALRGFRNSPGFVLTVIATLALGLGALGAAFSVFNSMVLKTFSVRDPYSLYAFMGWGEAPGGEILNRPFTLQEFKDFREYNLAFSEVLGYQNGTAPVEDKTASIQAVTGNYFSMLGGRICFGRPFRETHDQSREGVAVASYGAWRSRFGSDPGILGKGVRLGDKRMEIVGIACPEFNGPQIEKIDFWVSLALSRELAIRTMLRSPIPPQPQTEYPQLSVIGRLRPGLTKKSAEAALLAYGRNQHFSWRRRELRPEIARIQQQATSLPLNRDSIRQFMPMFLGFGLVLLIACANVSNMVLARGLVRRRELGIRLSLGASRMRIIRQLFTENLLLSIPAGLASYGVAYGIIRAGYSMKASVLPAAGALWSRDLPSSVLANVDLANALPDLRVMGFLLATAFVTTLFFGLLPAIQTTRSRLVQANRGEFDTKFGPARLRAAMVIAQATLCALLLILAGLAVRNEMRIASLDLGLDTRGVYQINVLWESDKAYFRALIDGLSPLVYAIGTSIKPPLDYPHVPIFHAQLSREDGTGEVPSMVCAVSPEYFDVYKIAVRGRKTPSKSIDIMQSGMPDGMEVVVSETVARQLWPSGDGLGRSVERRDRDPQSEKLVITHYPVVGIAGDSVGELYDSKGTLNPNRAILYWLQPPIEKHAYLDQIMLRLKGDPASGLRLLQTTAGKIVPDGTHLQMFSSREEMDRALYPYRVVVVITFFLAVVALLLTMSGIFGMLSYVIAQRRKEFGIRIALGAGKARVTATVLQLSLRLTIAGAVLGTLLAFLTGRMLSKSALGHRFDLFDAGGYALGLLLVVATALAAAWIPARRAVNVDPARTLHTE